MGRLGFRSRILCSLAIPGLLLFSILPAQASRASETTAEVEPTSGWQATIVSNNAFPPRLIAVGKRQQSLLLFEHNSPLTLAGTFVCTTGQAVGNKFVEGDLKTPEGVYFVGQRIASGLDYEKYGNEAYTLNYPNPVDKLRHKTGYGIWIHGRGVPITPNQTEGCIALNNTDLTLLGKALSPGAPVTLAEAVSYSSAPTLEDQDIINTLSAKTYGWAQAWASRSSELFDYYDPEAYAIAQNESFSAFRQQKERVFKKVSFIDIKLSNLQVLQGPGYWVAWFQQDYRASNLSTKGIRRLYWQKDKKGELRIVGMEWMPHLSGTLTAGLNNTPRSDVNATVKVKAQDTPSPIVTEADPTPTKNGYSNVDKFIESWRMAWQTGDLESYMTFYAKDAVQGTRSGIFSIRSHKAMLWGKSKPMRVELTNIRVASNKDTIVAEMRQDYTDLKNFVDAGTKTLIIQEKSGTWRIVREDWSPMQQ